MKRLLFILFLALCATAPAQTIRTLGYNSTNGQIVAATNVTWTNSFNFSTNAVAAQVRTNLSLGWSALTNTNAATSLLGFTTNGQVVANTGTNVLTFTNAATIAGISMNENGVFYGAAGVDFDSGMMRKNDGGELFNWNDDTRVSFALPIEFSNTTNAATSRANLGFSTNLNTVWTATNAAVVRSAAGLPLAALTNTSNVTVMRALAGSTNTNQPFSGIISFQDFDDQTHTVTVSNGVITSYIGP